MRSPSIVFAIVAIASVSSAEPSKDQCVDADTRAQTLRQSGKLQAARYELAICANTACPTIVRSDCLTRIEEIERVMPSITVTVSGARGEAVDYAITVDGAPLATSHGAPLTIDPGTHHFVFSAKGYAPIARDVVIREGEKFREVSARLGDTAPDAPPPSGSISWLRVTGVATFALGLVGIGVGAGLGAASFGAWSNVKRECLEASSCDVARATPDRASAIDFATGSDVAFVVGGVLAVTGALVYLLAPRDARVAPALGFGNRGGTVGLMGRF